MLRMSLSSRELNGPIVVSYGEPAAWGAAEALNWPLCRAELTAGLRCGQMPGPIPSLLRWQESP